MDELELLQVRHKMADFLKKARENTGLSHAAAAEASGLSKHCIINAEQCEFWLSTRQYVILCNTYNIKPFSHEL